MKKYFYQWLLLCAMTFVAACSDGGEEIDKPQTPSVPEQPTITLGGSSSSDFPTDGGSNTLSFTASTDWTAEVINSRADAWCSVSPTSGKAGNAQITITTTANDTPDNRSASVILKAGTTQKTITVSQKQKDALTVTSDKFEVSAEGGEIKIEVKANIDFEYSIAYEGAAKDWITSGGARALKTSTLTFKVAANEEVEKREATVTIKSGSFKEKVKVYQAGTTPSITLTKNEFVVASAGESIAVEVKSNVDVTVELPTDVDWISENQSRAMSTNTYHFTIAESQEYDQRTAEIKFTNKANNLSETVKVVQVQKDAIVVAKNEYEFTAEGGELDFEILTNVDVTVSIPDSISNWVKQVKSRALVSQILHFDISPCDLSESRSGTITLSGGNAVQKILIKQEQMKIDPAAIPDNEIWYVTNLDKDGYVYELNPIAFDANVVEHVYEGGKWIIRFDKGLKSIEWPSLINITNNTIITELYLPNTLEHLGNMAAPLEIKEFYVPKNLKSIFMPEVLFGDKLERFYGDNVSEDGRCIVVDNKLLAFAPAGLEEYTIPTDITTIGQQAVCSNELKTITIPEGVTILEIEAFMQCPNIEYINLPSSLTEMGGYAFHRLHNLKKINGNCKFISDDGYSIVIDNYFQGKTFLVNFASGAGLASYNIPEGIEGIESYAFYGAETLKELSFPNSLTELASAHCFEGTYNIERIYGANVLDDNRSLVVDGKLLYVAPKGLKEYTTPVSVTQLGYGVLAQKPELEKIIISDEVTSVDSYGYLMSYNPNLKEVTISAHMEKLGNGPFDACEKLETVYCRAVVPPVLSHHNAPWLTDIFTIYVPRESLSAYLNSPYWQEDLIYIKPYDYTDLPETDYYTSTDYSQDGKVTALQTATKGNGIDIVLMGDGYSDRQIADGTYKNDMEYIYNNLFTEEPYKSFKDYFNVHYVNVVSATEGYEYGNTALDGYFGDGTLVGGNDNTVFTYAQKAISTERMDEALLIVAMNSNNYAGTCYMYYPSVTGGYGNGISVSYFPKGENAETFAQLLHHEALGHGFSKLADEYAYEDMGAIPATEVTTTKEQQNNWGWWKNVDFTSDPSATRWSHFINDTRYANDGLGAYEGGLTYWTGVWRPTENSIMRYNTGGFNAPSREAIYYRIHKLAYGDSWQYDYEEFVKYDAINRKAAASSYNPYRQTNYKPLHAPVVIRKSWKDAK